MSYSRLNSEICSVYYKLTVFNLEKIIILIIVIIFYSGTNSSIIQN